MSDTDDLELDTWHPRAMKRRSLMEHTPREFDVMPEAELSAFWYAPPMTHLRDLHRCHLLCGRIPGRIHFEECQYVKGADYRSALQIAVRYLGLLPEDEPIRWSTSATALDPSLEEGSALAELTLSFLSDPITVRGDGTFGNGRHRVAAIIDAQMDLLIPVVRMR
ncbi:hypothetical protein [Microbacterium testaceum]|uniref:hypothetical protein n=1 Tax=Microbacterium testaceum TaxID=2033 RepID=UPI0007345DC5|nr:hypothetical protein [Microbacterium testaceum]